VEGDEIGGGRVKDISSTVRTLSLRGCFQTRGGGKKYDAVTSRTCRVLVRGKR